MSNKSVTSAVADPQSRVSTKPPLEHGLSLRGITKVFGNLIANDHIDLDIQPGRIHCLLGENGAGKSTLMNVLYGLLDPTEGDIYIDGVKQKFTSPRLAMEAGIGMVHQHFMLIEVFTVAENIILGREQGPFGTLNMRQARRKVRELAERYQLPVDPDALIEDLPVGVRQRVEILKALTNDAKYLILDEPTAVLTPQEIDDLMAVMRALRDDGKAIVFITHKLREVQEVADDITVIRLGKVVGEALPGTTTGELAEMMVGRAVQLKVLKDQPKLGEVNLKVNDLVVANTLGDIVVDHVSFDIRAGEILGIAGVQGNGQTELTEAMLGLAAVKSGTVELAGTDVTASLPHQRLRAGLGYIPEGRQRDGFVASFSVAENLVLDRVEDFSAGWNLKLDKIRQNADTLVDEFDVRTQSIDLPVSSLSGGNQQKVVLARELSRPLKVLVASQPTRGVDVGAIEFLHHRIVEERDNGTAVLLVSTELEEIENLSDRIAVMFRGKIVGIVDSGTPRDILGLMMAGMTYDEAVQAVGTNPAASSAARAEEGAEQ